MLVIGIDPGTAITGYGLVREEKNGRLTVVDYGVVKTSAKMPMPKRLLSSTINSKKSPFSIVPIVVRWRNYFFKPM